MLFRIFSLTDTMSSVGVCHHGEVFVMAYQFVDQCLTILVVAIIITCSVNEEQITL